MALGRPILQQPVAKQGCDQVACCVCMLACQGVENRCLTSEGFKNRIVFLYIYKIFMSDDLSCIIGYWVGILKSTSFGPKKVLVS